MNRLSWDTTAPRRPNGRRLSKPGPEHDVVEASSVILPIPWDKLRRVTPY